MTNRAVPFIIAALVCLIIWAAIVKAVVGDSRQQCEIVASSDTCQWELR